MRKTLTFFKLLALVFLMTSLKLGAQCTNFTSYGTASAPPPGTSITAVSCQYAGEYATITFTAGNTYSIASTVLGDYFTVRSGSSSGPVAVAGAGPLIFTPTTTATYYVHCNTNASCGLQSTCRNVIIGCYGPSCNFSSPYGTASAPAVNAMVVITTCNFGGEYATVSSVVAGNYYTSASSVGTDYFTIRSGSASGPVVANGLSPLTWTAQVSGTHYIHVATNSLCATASACRSNSLTCTGPGPALCSGSPNTPTASISSSVGCPSINFTMLSNGNSVASGLNYQWQSSTAAAGTYANLTGATATILTTNTTTTTYYRMITTCTVSGLTSTSSVVSYSIVNPGPCVCNNYGTIAASSTGDEEILGVVFGNLNNVSTCTTTAPGPGSINQRYSNYTGFVTAPDVCMGAAVPFTVTANTCGGWYPSVGLNIYIDFNQNGLFTDAGELVYSVVSATQGVNTSSITIPTTATNGTTRMRIVLVEGAVPGPNNAYTWGETEDYCININPQPTVALSSNSGSICPGGSFTVSASGALTYTFTGPTSTITGASVTLSPIANTIYTVNGTNSIGCRTTGTNIATATITTLASPALAVSSSTSAICSGFTTSLSVTGANTYTWISPASNATQIAVSPTATTIYTVSGTGTNVCNGFNTTTITVYSLPTISVNSGTSCAGSVFTLTPSGAVTYTYSSGSNTVAPSTSTFYAVSGTNTFGCVSATTAIANVSVSALPVVSASSGTMCSGSFYNIIPSGATSYTVIGAGNPVSPTVTSTYSVIGSTSVGCNSLPALSTVTVFNLPNVTAVSSPSSNVICNTSLITMNASGASTYTWNGTVSGASISATPSVSGSYFVIGSDANGCTNVATIPFTVNPLPALAFSATNTFVCAGGSATLTSGGALNYTWTTGSNSTLQVVSPTVSTVYSLTGDNSFGCSKTLTLSVNVNTIVMTASSNTAVCLGNSINLNANGASNYTWAPVPSPFSNVNVTPSVTSSYTVIGKDSKNCFHTAVITVSVNPNPVVSASTSNSIICVGESATLTATGATAYLWSITSSTNNTGSPLVVTPTQANTFNYVVTGTDVNECSGTDTVMVKVEKCTGITSISKEINGISVYPNPNNGSFKVEMINGLKKYISVTDVSGRLIFTSESSEDVIDVNLSAFANGIYYVKVQSESTLEVIQVIKQ